MKIALISSLKNLNFEKYISKNCKEIRTNIPNLADSIQGIPITYCKDKDELIKDADWVTVICDIKHAKASTVISRCKKYHVSFEIIIADEQL
ncbi:MAG: hypothetical protein J6S71_04520 [Clostridia bacterium]|nr:hypothetical protein [Clostridia bacterium]